MKQDKTDIAQLASTSKDKGKKRMNEAAKDPCAKKHKQDKTRKVVSSVTRMIMSKKIVLSTMHGVQRNVFFQVWYVLK